MIPHGGRFVNLRNIIKADKSAYVSKKSIGGNNLNCLVEERAVELGEYIVNTKATVRAAAKEFGISKSTVHMDVSQRLKKIDPHLYGEVKEILEINKAQRHIRGGLATKNKYAKMK